MSFDRRVQRLVATYSQDADGGPVSTWATERTIWCNRQDRDGREYRTSSALRSESTAVFTLRWFAGLKAADRLLCEGRTYDIVGEPAELGRRQFWRVEAAERQGQV